MKYLLIIFTILLIFSISYCSDEDGIYSQARFDNFASMFESLSSDPEEEPIVIPSFKVGFTEFGPVNTGEITDYKNVNIGYNSISIDMSNFTSPIFNFVGPDTLGPFEENMKYTIKFEFETVANEPFNLKLVLIKD